MPWGMTRRMWNSRYLLADGAHDARGRAVAHGRQLLVLEDQLVIGRNRLDRVPRFHEDNPVAARLEVLEQVRRRRGGCLLEVVHPAEAFGQIIEPRLIGWTGM